MSHDATSDDSEDVGLPPDSPPADEHPLGFIEDERIRGIELMTSEGLCRFRDWGFHA
jgi:hypothetical protein